MQYFSMVLQTSLLFLASWVYALVSGSSDPRQENPREILTFYLHRIIVIILEVRYNYSVCVHLQKTQSKQNNTTYTNPT